MINMNPETYQTRPYCSSDLAPVLVPVPALVIVPELVPELELEPVPVHVSVHVPVHVAAGRRSHDIPFA